MNKNIVLYRIRSGNNYYMWKPSNQCLSTVDSQLDVWHKKLGYMNVHELSRLVKVGVVRGVLILENSSETVCEVCIKGKQIKVQHKKIFEISSKTIRACPYGFDGTDSD